MVKYGYRLVKLINIYKDGLHVESMKLKDLFSRNKNKCNQQEILYAKKKLIKKLGYDDIDDVLDMEVAKRMKKW